MHLLDELLMLILDVSILLFEYIGVGIIVVNGIIAFICYLRRDPLTRLRLAKGMATGLEFKLGGEILRTVVMRDFTEILLVGSIILLRAGLTFLIHWEIKNEESEHAEQQAAELAAEPSPHEFM